MSVASDILEQSRNPLGNALVFDSYRDKAVTEGRSFFVVGTTPSILASGSYYLLYRAPIATSGRLIRLVDFHFSSIGNTLLAQAYEGPTVSNVGTATIPHNCNHNKPDNSKLLVYYGSTISADGLLFGQATTTTGGSEATLHGHILNPDTYHTIKMTNSGAGLATVGYCSLEFIEEYT